MKIEELISSIRRREIVVPEFQREFVWNKSRARELIYSLLNEYPVGGILIWKTDEPPHLKGEEFKEGHEQNKVYQVLLDGQQRSTALYMLITGEIPPYYKEDEIGDDPRMLAYNLYSRELRYWRQSSMGKDESWQLVTDIMAGNVVDTKLAFAVHKKFEKLNGISDFEFDFSVKDRTRAFGEIRSLVESAGLQMNFAAQQIWKILLPSKTINVTISELQKLYVGSVNNIPEGEWSDDDFILDEVGFRQFWKTKVAIEATKLAAEHADLEQLVTTFNKNYRDLLDIKRLDVFRQDIPQSAKFTDAIDIFDKINSQGVHLSNAELALTHITAIWPEARRKMKSFLDGLADKNFHLNLTFTTRLLILAACGRASLSALSAASYEPIRDLNKDQLSSAWDISEKVFSYVVDVLRSEKITNSEIIRSKNVLFPVFYYVFLSGGTFKTDKERRSALYWLHNALIWGRYAGSADQKLEEDINIIKNSGDVAWSGMINKIVDQRGRINLEANDLEGSGADGRIFNTFYVMLKHKGAQDWFTGVSLDSPEDSDFATHKHHIFPKALLVRNGYSEQNKIQNALMNEIANLAIITDVTNIKISDKEPAKYFHDVEQKYPSALVNQLIPKSSNLWFAASFLDFLKARRELLATEINQFLGKYWKDEISETSDQGAYHLWSMPESEVLEFKETWQFDVVQSEREAKTVKNSKLQLACVKTVAGFMNSLGGDLLIGVSDSNLVEGLGRDLEIFSKSLDKLELNINQVLTNSLGISKSPYYSIKILEVDGKTVCHIQVSANRSSKTWVKFGGEEYFFVRQGNGTKRLSGEEADQYWVERLNI
jgi:hypothetical protein